MMPADAVQLSDCVPGMGYHYANPEKLPFGPIYLVDDGRVVGIEYMIAEKDLESGLAITGDHSGGEVFSMPLPEISFDHADIQYLPEGHEGFEDAHYDLHYFLISQEEKQGLCE